MRVYVQFLALPQKPGMVTHVSKPGPVVELNGPSLTTQSSSISNAQVPVKDLVSKTTVGVFGEQYWRLTFDFHVHTHTCAPTCKCTSCHSQDLAGKDRL